MMAEKMGMRAEKAVEKSQFSVTCSLLNQYLKEKGSCGSIGLEMAPRPKDMYRAPTTLSLLPGVDVSTEDHAHNGADQNAPKSMEFFPRRTRFGSPVLAAREEPVKTPPNNKDVEKAQLTIFYGGKVLVFEDFPAAKAKDLMQMAGKESTAAQNLGFTAPSNSSAGADYSSKPNSIFASASGSRPPKPARANASDMPIARRNSLHRFLEKRKDRISTKAPYQAHDVPGAKPEGSQA